MKFNSPNKVIDFFQEFSTMIFTSCEQQDGMAIFF